MPISIKAYQDEALDRSFNKSAGRLLSQIKAITNAPRSQVQRSLRDLDKEADRLVEEKERMKPTNAHLEKALRDNEAAFVATQTMILANDDGIQLSGQSLAVNAVTAKVFSAIAQQLIANNVDPMSSAGLNVFKQRIESAGISWATPDATTFARDFVDSSEWLAKMEGWGSGYSERLRDAMIDGISKGWGPKKTAAEMRRYAQNLPVSAAENLTRTLQLTSFREASAAMETANSEFVEGKIRIATLDDRTCLNCLALHGTPLKLGERVDDHYRGRCSEFYQVLGGPKFPEQMQADSTPGNRNFVPYQSGEEWFNSLPPDRQAKQASFLKSPAKLRAYRDGVPLNQFVGDHTDDVFGHQFVEKSLVGAIGDDAVGYYTNKPKPPDIEGVGGGVKEILRDNDGNPISFYHGTGHDFETFDVSERIQTDGTIKVAGGWFTIDKSEARQYSLLRGSNPRVIEANLRMSNPLRITLTETGQYKSMVEAVNQEYIDDLKSKGYDGIIFDYDMSGPYGSNQKYAEVVVFSPSQIKTK